MCLDSSMTIFLSKLMYQKKVIYFMYYDTTLRGTTNIGIAMASLQFGDHEWTVALGMWPSFIFRHRRIRVTTLSIAFPKVSWERLLMLSLTAASVTGYSDRHYPRGSPRGKRPEIVRSANVSIPTSEIALWLEGSFTNLSLLFCHPNVAVRSKK